MIRRRLDADREVIGFRVDIVDVIPISRYIPDKSNHNDDFLRNHSNSLLNI
jgi:hypothetical protein